MSRENRSEVTHAMTVHARIRLALPAHAGRAGVRAQAVVIASALAIAAAVAAT